jgi:hypothetical protein
MRFAPLEMIARHAVSRWSDVRATSDRIGAGYQWSARATRTGAARTLDAHHHGSRGGSPVCTIAGSCTQLKRPLRGAQ